MRIEVASGVGSGPTEVAAFDAALCAAGVANFNLVGLTGVIPAGAEVVLKDRPAVPAGEWGDRLYAVIAQRRVTLPGAQAWAGLGWVQDEASGLGLFASHCGASRTEVERGIADRLTALCQNRGETFDSHHMQVVGATCTADPACAVVVAAYDSAPW